MMKPAHTSQPNILVFALTNANKSPRIARAIQALSSTYQVSFLGFSCNHPEINSYLLTRQSGLRTKLTRLFARIFRRFKLNERLSYRLPQGFSFSGFDLVLTHDLEALPYIYLSGYTGKVALDAREYYPRHFEHSFWWRLLNAPFQDYLCETYLKRLDKAFTVSEGLRNEYLRCYQTDMEVLYSLPPAYKLTPTPTDRRPPLKLIHHGNAVPQRKLENMIYAMDSLCDKATLDLVLIGDSNYTNHLKALAKQRANVNIIPPVALIDIVPMLSRYDIGVVFLPASTFNLEHCMPNKLFECLQARLCLVCSPLKDISDFLETNDCGIICTDHSAQALAKAIEQLTPAKVDHYKAKSHQLASQYNDNINSHRLLEAVGSLLPKQA